MHFFKSIVIATALSSGLLAQEPSVPPVQAKRLPPEKSKPKPSGANNTLIDKYDFGAQINALQDTNRLQRWRAGSQSDAGVKSPPFSRRLVSLRFLRASGPRPTCNSPRRRKKLSR